MINFTIITCTFNASKYIDRTLNSVRSQSYPHIEHFIIDGVSKDDTVKKAQTYAYDSRYPVIVKSEPDKGLYDAMNKGIKLAKGDYIIFLNAGDEFAEEDILTSVAEQLKGKQFPGVIYGNTDIVDENGNFLRKRRLAPPEKLSWKSFKHGMLVCHQSFYAKTEIAQKVPYNLNYKLSADVDWCIRIMKEAEQQGLALWNTHMTLSSYLEGGMSVKSHRASLKERFKIMSGHYGKIATIGMHLWFVVRAILKR
ncbi:MAG: glycosyltransferase family 2 protein [Prevotellaceae bacterium]|nr:glycosyltransferase family 2 protein [Prevotellaceae bacterium]